MSWCSTHSKKEGVFLHIHDTCVYPQSSDQFYRRLSDCRNCTVIDQEQYLSMWHITFALHFCSQVILVNRYLFQMHVRLHADPSPTDTHDKVHSIFSLYRSLLKSILLYLTIDQFFANHPPPRDLKISSILWHNVTSQTVTIYDLEIKASI